MTNTAIKTNDAQPLDSKLIDAIVREVVARVAAQRAVSKPSVERQSVGDSAAGQLVLAPALISLATLADRLSGVERLVVGTKTVITPAARDLLRQHKITISRSADAQALGGAGSKPALAVAIADTAFDAAALLRMVAPVAGEIERLAKTGLTNSIQEISETVTKDGRLGLLLCGRPDVACCLANRRPGVRAAVVRDRDEVAAAIANLGVNLLVVDPARRSLFQLGQIVKPFLVAGSAKCPPALAAQLG
jgi:hypothetical protein